MGARVEPDPEAIRSRCRAYGVTRLELFGSAARVNFNSQRSGIDLLVEFAHKNDILPRMSYLLS
jgi:predicted nucleotidyltransferase